MYICVYVIAYIYTYNIYIHTWFCFILHVFCNYIIYVMYFIYYIYKMYMHIMCSYYLLLYMLLYIYYILCI